MLNGVEPIGESYRDEEENVPLHVILREQKKSERAETKKQLKTSIETLLAGVLVAAGVILMAFAFLFESLVLMLAAATLLVGAELLFVDQLVKNKRWERAADLLAIIGLAGIWTSAILDTSLAWTMAAACVILTAFVIQVIGIAKHEI